MERLQFIDALRGFALFGVFWANLLIFSGITYMSDEHRATLFASGLDSFAYTLERFLIENKFIGLFSFLFGVSFWLFLSRTERRGGSGTRLFYRRILFLFVFGAIHGWLFWAFDVLRFYALWAALLPLFVRIRPRRVLEIALAACVLVPALVVGLNAWIPTPTRSTVDFDALALTAFATGSYREVLVANWKYDWYLTNSVGQIAYQVAVFGRILLGLYVARALDLGNLDVHRGLLRRVFLGAGAVGLVGSVVFAGKFLTGGAEAPLLAFMRRFLVESGHLGLTLAYASGLALAFLDLRKQSMVGILAPVGRMALTWYLLQTALGIWMFYGFARGPALMGKAGPASLAALALAGFAVQVWLALLWLGRFRMGPAEWLWRMLTYGKTQPFRVTSS